MRATAALFTLVALLAAAPAAASVERDTFVLPVDTLLPCGVGGETIHLTGTASYHVLSVADPAGGFRLLIGANGVPVGNRPHHGRCVQTRRQLPGRDGHRRRRDHRFEHRDPRSADRPEWQSGHIRPNSRDLA